MRSSGLRVTQESGPPSGFTEVCEEEAGFRFSTGMHVPFREEALVVHRLAPPPQHAAAGFPLPAQAPTLLTLPRSWIAQYRPPSSKKRIACLLDRQLSAMNMPEHAEHPTISFAD